MKYSNYNLVDSKHKIAALKTAIRQILFFMLIMVSFGAIAQNDYAVSEMSVDSNNQKIYQTISFGDKISFGKIGNTATWSVINTAEKIAVNLRGMEINDYVFEKTGLYEIRFSENKKQNDECSHPLFDEKMLIKVNPVKMVFDFSKIAFSERIERGRNYQDLIITVPVNITFKENAPAKLTSPGLSIAGIGVALVAKPLVQEVVVKNGIQFLKYQLSGIINRETYLMFDFSDFNNQVQTYNHLQIIN